LPCEFLWVFTTVNKKNPHFTKKRESVERVAENKAPKTIGWISEMMFKKISQDQAIKESALVEYLEFHGLSVWSWLRLRSLARERLEDRHPEVKYNKKEKLYYIGLLDNSLTSIPLPERHKLK